MRKLGLKGISKVRGNNKGAYITMIKKHKHEAKPRSASHKGKPLSPSEISSYMSHVKKKQKHDKAKHQTKLKARAKKALIKDRKKALDNMYSKDDLYEGIKHYKGSKKAWHGFNKRMTKAKMIDMVVTEGLAIRAKNIPKRKSRKRPRQKTIKGAFEKFENKSKKRKTKRKRKKRGGWFGDKRAHSRAAKLGWERRNAKLVPASDEEIKNVQHKRSKRARSMDAKSTSRKTLKRGDKKTRYWTKRPGRYDIEGVDTAGQAKNKLERMQGAGGSRWQKHGKDRMYFNRDFLMNAIGLELSFYKSGNVFHARLNGKKISNTKGSRLFNKINSAKVFYDIKTNNLEIQDNYDQLDDKHKKKINDVIAGL